MRCPTSLALVVLMVSSQAACEDRSTPAPAPKPASDRASSPAPEAKPTAEPAATTAPASTTQEVTFALDGEPRRLAIREPGHATINRLTTPPTVAIVARVDDHSPETLIIKLGGVDLDRAALPLELRALGGGGPKVSFTYVDAAGTRSSGELDASATNDHLILEDWDPAQRRLRGRFAVTLSNPSTQGPSSTRALTRGSLDVVLHDPFDR